MNVEYTSDMVRVVHGKWEEVDDVWDDLHYRCSACGCEWFLEDGTPAENGMNFCPRCGAKMDQDVPACGPDYCEI